MMNLKLWLNQQGLSVRELALQMEVPLKTVQDWVYRRIEPSPVNREKLNELVRCTHHWVIEGSNGPLSEGVCQNCGEKREFKNSGGLKSPWSSRQTPPRKNGAVMPGGSNGNNGSTVVNGNNGNNGTNVTNGTNGTNGTI